MVDDPIKDRQLIHQVLTFNCSSIKFIDTVKWLKRREKDETGGIKYGITEKAV